MDMVPDIGFHHYSSSQGSEGVHPRARQQRVGKELASLHVRLQPCNASRNPDKTLLLYLTGREAGGGAGSVVVWLGDFKIALYVS